MVDVKEEILSKLCGTRLIWEMRNITWSIEGIFNEEPVQVVHVVNPFQPTPAVRS
jgi:hypothetical protein